MSPTLSASCDIHHGMSLYRRAALAAPLVLVAALVGAGSGADGAPAKGPKTVTISGTAYQFASTHHFLVGGTVHVLEDKSATASVAADGTYTLTVKNNADVTPYVTADGYGTTYLQTFHTDGADLLHVNFQTPTADVIPLLAFALDAPLENGYPAQCAIVSTVNTKQVRGVSYDQFVEWGAHGVAGVVATLTPEKGTKLTKKQKRRIKETYFDHTTTPNATQFPTSLDGGVGWTHVPPGKYRLTAHGAGSSWAPVHVTCANGRIVNANPPWGLHQLATTIDTAMTTNWDATSGTPKLTELQLGTVPTQVADSQGVSSSEDIDFNGQVTVSCRGDGCFDPVTVSGSMTGPTDLLPALGDAVDAIAPGQTISVAIAVPGYNTRIESWRIPAKGWPTLTTTCIPFGDTEILASCD